MSVDLLTQCGMPNFVSQDQPGSWCIVFLKGVKSSGKPKTRDSKLFSVGEIAVLCEKGDLNEGNERVLCQRVMMAFTKSCKVGDTTRYVQAAEKVLGK